MGKTSIDFQAIIDFLTNGSYPVHCVGDKGVKANFRKKAGAYGIRDGVLVFKHHARRNTHTEEVLLRVIIDIDERHQIISMTHEGCDSSVEATSIGGHIGIDKTRLKIIERFWWPGISEDVINFIRTCDRCQRAATKIQKGVPEMKSVPIHARPWHQIGVDVCQLTASDDGYKYIVVAVDYYTKWCEAEPLRTKTAVDVSRFLYKLICRHGCCRIQINDQGREFVNSVSTELFKLCGTKQRMTTAYHPQANGLVERQNGTIQRSLLKMLGDKHSQWSNALNGVLFAFRTNKQKSTGYTPFYLMYGRDAVLPMEVTEERAPTDTDDGAQSAVIDDQPIDDDDLQHRLDQIERLRNVAEDVSDNIEKAQERQQADYNRRNRSKRVFEVDEKVLKWNCVREDRKGGKELDTWTGPYIVVDRKENTYTLSSTAGKLLKKKVNGCNLKPYVERQMPPQFSSTPKAHISVEDTPLLDESPRPVKQKRKMYAPRKVPRRELKLPSKETGHDDSDDDSSIREEAADSQKPLTQQPTEIPFAIGTNPPKRSSRRDQKITVCNVDITTDDLGTLDGSNWLNDKIILAYLNLLMREVNETRVTTHVFMLPSFLHSFWTQGQFAHWLFSMIIFNDFDRILLPVCEHSHWYLVMMESGIKRITVFDSMGNERDQTVEYVKKYMSVRGETLEENLKTGWVSTTANNAHQMDGSSCGVFVLMNAEALLRKEDTTTVDQDYVAPYRLYVRDRLIEAGVPYHDRVCSFPHCNTKTTKKSAFSQCEYCSRWMHTACCSPTDSVFRCCFCTCEP